MEPIYLVAGDEPLLVAEALEQIREAARAREFLDRSLHIVDRSFKWDVLEREGENLSLFASRRVLEVRLGSPRPGDKGVAAIVELAESPDPDRIVLIGVMAKLDSAAARSRWVKSVEQHGAVVDVWPVRREELPRWIQARARRAGIELTGGAAGLLADRVEGNLLAADQEIQKLGLNHAGQTVDEPQVLAAVANSARFDVFRLTDALIGADVGRTLRVLSSLRADGTQPVLVSWAIGREIVLLTKLRLAVDSGTPVDRALRESGVWRQRQAAVKAAVGKLGLPALRSLLSMAADVDAVVKGAKFGQPWDALTGLVIAAHRARAPVP